MAARPMRKLNVTGGKRPAESDPDGDQPLTKKFGHLHIGSFADCSHPDNQDEASILRPSSSQLTDTMLVDDTKNTVYIHDLDREIAEAEDRPGITLLPGVTSITSIPRVFLTDPKPQSNELVLYREPVSLTVPFERDSVRKAIIEHRAQIRARRVDSEDSLWKSLGGTPVQKVGAGQVKAEANEEEKHHRHHDAMDVDV